MGADSGQIDRYVILERIGRGGMGEVWRAFDPRLEREVAIKVLRTARGNARARLLREAEALARVAHPNVVGIFDVGTDERGVFLAMELVPGLTLRGWLAADKPSPARILAAYRQAALGLAAAHEQGLVHRDFKPDNAIFGDDGRVRVLDFGLAVDDPDDPSTPRVRESDSFEEPRPEPSTRLTQTGVAMGTPAYMAPEQHQRRDAGPAADQYAWCVALYEALVGRRPFSGRDLDVLRRAKLEGLGSRPRPEMLSRGVWAAIVRGTAPDPARRHPSMHALLHALHPRRRTRWLVVPLGLGAVATVVVASEDAAQQRCAAEVSPLRRAWTEARLDAAQRGIVSAQGIPTAFATAVSTDVRLALDDYARRWTDEFVATCRAALATPDDRELDQRSQCLRRGLDASTAMLDELARADRRTVLAATEVARTLPSPDACRDRDAPSWSRLPADQRAIAERATAQLETARTLAALGRMARAEELVAEARATTESLSDPTLRIEAMERHGRLLLRLGQLERAEALLTEAALIGWAEGGPNSGGTAAAMAAYTIGVTGGRIFEAERWLRLAAAVLARADDPDPGLALDVASVRGSLAFRAGDPEAALTHYREAYELSLSGSPALRALHVQNVGVALQSLGRLGEARAKYLEALDLKTAARGENHPSVSYAHFNAGLTYLEEDLVEPARRHFEATLRIREAVFGPDHPDVGLTLLALGDVARREQRWDDARTLLERGLAIQRAGLGEDNPNLADGLRAVARLQRDVDEIDAARRTLDEARRLLVAEFGPDHGDVAEVDAVIADLAGE